MKGYSYYYEKVGEKTMGIRLDWIVIMKKTYNVSNKDIVDKYRDMWIKYPGLTPRKYQMYVEEMIVEELENKKEVKNGTQQ